MVLTNQMKTSALSKKKMKQEYKGKKKDNYKKKKIVKEECCICYNDVEVCSDNTIKCGKVNHTICRSCKVQMKDEDCPMCRSHKIKQPVHQIVKIKIIQKPYKSKGFYEDIKLTPKQRRNYNRKHMFNETFHINSNRLIRQRSNRTGRLNQSGLQTLSSDRRTPSVNSNWFTREQVLRYNGSLRTDYDSASDSSEDSDSDSDSVSTLSITDTELAERVEELVNAWED